MIPQALIPEPSDFDARARQPGNTWLAENPGRWPKGDTTLWRPFLPALQVGFRHLCGYSAMFEPCGTVDHWLSQKNRRDLIFEWTNYRYVAGWVNQSKKPIHDGKILDPFEVHEGWFRLLLPSCQLEADYERIPKEQHLLARETLRVLKLADRENLVSQRQEWYRMYRDKELTLEGLRKKAPLIAQAVERMQEAAHPADQR